MIDHGTFEAYTPSADNPIAAEIPGALFARRISDGVDWYELQRSIGDGGVALLISDGLVVSASRDVSMLPLPSGCRVVEIEISPEDFARGLLHRRFDGGSVIFPENDMASERIAAHTEAWRYGEAIIARELGNWTSAEQLSWDLQKAESQIVIDGGTLPATALIPGLAEDKGVSVEEYATGVLEYAARFQAITRAAIKLRRGVAILLSDTLDTPAKLEAAVADLKAQADSFAAELIGAPE